jgi:uncharacterized protein YgiM (DUF1202 family)
MIHKMIRIAAVCMAALMVMGTLALGIGTRTALAQETGSNWTGYYWSNIDFSGNPTVTRTDAAVNFNWKTGSPDANIPGDNFSVRWYNQINFGAGTYRFRAGADDGIRVAIDGVLVINRFSDATGGFTVTNVDVPLSAGVHTIIIDYYEKTGEAGILFDWGSPTGGTSGTTATSIAPVATAVPAGPPVRAVVIVQIANVRSGPSTLAEPIAEVKLNDDFKVLAQNGANTWFVIQLPDGRTGWIFRRTIYLYNGDWTKLPVTLAPVEPAGVPQDVQGVTKTMVFVRNYPSTRGDKIGVINQGEYFKVIKLSRNFAWIWVEYNGLAGWVYLPNVKITFGQLGRLPFDS